MESFIISDVFLEKSSFIKISKSWNKKFFKISVCILSEIEYVKEVEPEYKKEALEGLKKLLSMDDLALSQILMEEFLKKLESTKQPSIFYNITNSRMADISTNNGNKFQKLPVSSMVKIISNKLCVLIEIISNK